MWNGRFLQSTLTILLSCSALSAADEHIVLPPTTLANVTMKMLIFIPGGNVPNEHYIATAQSIQQAAEAHQLSLWVVIPAVFQRLCIISCTAKSVCSPLHYSVEAALSKAVERGWKRGNDTEDLWLAGHSLGGVCANTLFQAYQSPSKMPYAGLIVMGSYVDETGDFDLISFPVPVLTLNVELDGGLARPGKTSTWHRQHLDLEKSEGAETALRRKPVIILPKMNHSNFCPGFDVPGDLPAEITQAEATRIIGDSVAAFLVLNVQSTSGDQKLAASQLLNGQLTWTKQLLGPYLAAQAMERTATDTRTSPEGSSSFCAMAQHLMAGLPETYDEALEVFDGYHVSDSNLEHCHPNYTASGVKLLVHSCSHSDYYSDIDNTGSITAASEIACKLLSAARVAQQLNVSAEQPLTSCSAINRASVQMAEKLAPASTLQRFRSKGRGWCFLDDVESIAGPLWVFKDALQLKENATCMSVQSPALRTELDGRIYPGVQYCKFLAPARVLDWMMTDSLKPAKMLDTPIVI